MRSKDPILWQRQLVELEDELVKLNSLNDALRLDAERAEQVGNFLLAVDKQDELDLVEHLITDLRAEIKRHKSDEPQA